MKTYSSLKDLEEILLNMIEVEEVDDAQADPKDLAKSKGTIEASKYGLSTIKVSALASNSKRKITKDQLISSMNKKIENGIYELMRGEDSYILNPNEELSYDLAYYSSLVDTLQLIRDKIEDMFE